MVPNSIMVEVTNGDQHTSLLQYRVIYKNNLEASTVVINFVGYKAWGFMFPYLTRVEVNDSDKHASLLHYVNINKN